MAGIFKKLIDNLRGETPEQIAKSLVDKKPNIDITYEVRNLLKGAPDSAVKNGGAARLVGGAHKTDMIKFIDSLKPVTSKANEQGQWRKETDKVFNINSRINNLESGKAFYDKDGNNVAFVVTPNHSRGKSVLPYTLQLRNTVGEIRETFLSKKQFDILSKGTPEEIKALLANKMPGVKLMDEKPSITMDDLTRDKDGHIRGMADAQFKSKNGEVITNVNGAVADMYPGKDIFFERENGRPVDVKNMKLVENSNPLTPNFYSSIQATVNGKMVFVPLNKEETEMYKEMDDWHRVELFDYKCSKIAIKDADNLNMKEGSVQALRTDEGAKLAIFKDGKVIEVGLNQKEVNKVLALDDSKRGKYLTSLVPWQDLKLEVPDKLELGKSSLRALSGNEEIGTADEKKEKGLDIKNVQAMAQGSFQSASIDNPENQERQRGAGLGM